MKMMKIADSPGSSPVYDYEILEAAIACSPPPSKGEVSLQKLDGTDIYEWHYRTDTYWHGDGNKMVIVRDTPAAKEGL
jgi:hypothetical protein